MRIAITGYYGTGSSAIVDLLAEYKGCSEGGLRNYEHIPLYVPDGLFDLESKLLYNNDLHRSDEAIKAFRKAMYRLSDEYQGWFGSYQHYYGNQFKEITDRFIDNLVQYKCMGQWYHYYETPKFSLVKFAKDCLKAILPGKEPQGAFGKVNRIPPEQMMELSFISPEDFYRHARQFIRELFHMIQGDHQFHLILDHLVFPHHAYKIDRFFDEDFRLIIVDRDVRDLYVLCKHVWPRLQVQAPYPREKEAFLALWNRIRGAERPCDSQKVLRVHFEDLIYRYDETVAQIEAFVGLTPEDHIAPKTRFDPARSINNTQNFRIRPEWTADVADIPQKTQDIYDFPYDRVANIEDTFDI